MLSASLHYLPSFLMTGKDCVYVGTHLHVNDGIDEEQHGHEEADIKAEPGNKQGDKDYKIR